MSDVSTLIRKKRKGLTLAQYVKRRNGVPLGAKGSLENMLYRSFGAGSFAKFWHYWNPIWGYALGKYINAPLQRFMPVMLAVIITFTASGAIHDAVATLVRGKVAILFTPWFFFMSLIVVGGDAMNLDYSSQPFVVRATINFFLIFICFSISFFLMDILIP